MLQLLQIQKSYWQGEIEYPALKGINLDVNQGEMVALCGPSGSGKSTLLNICGLLDHQFEGEIHLAGTKVEKDPKQRMLLRRQQLGFVFQRFNLIPVMTVFENIAYPLTLNGVHPTQIKRRVSELLEAVGLAAFAQHRPDRLSGGQQQRVALARALVHEPLLVIADEPTASLDSKTAQQVVGLMRTIGAQQNTTFIIASHDERMTQHCDRIIHLQDGVLQAERDLCDSVLGDNMNKQKVLSR